MSIKSVDKLSGCGGERWCGEFFYRLPVVNRFIHIFLVNETMDEDSCNY